MDRTSSGRRHSKQEGQALIDRIAADGADHITGRGDTAQEALLTRGPWRRLMLSNQTRDSVLHPQERVTRAMTHADSVHFRAFLEARAAYAKQWARGGSGEENDQAQAGNAEKMERLGRAARWLAAEAALGNNPALTAQAMDIMELAGGYAAESYSGTNTGMPENTGAQRPSWPKGPDAAANHGRRAYIEADALAGAFTQISSDAYRMTVEYLIAEKLADEAAAAADTGARRIRNLEYGCREMAEAHTEILDLVLSTGQHDSPVWVLEKVTDGTEVTARTYRELEEARQEVLATALAALLMPDLVPEAVTVGWARRTADQAVQAMGPRIKDNENGRVNRIMAERAAVNARTLLRETEHQNPENPLPEVMRAQTERILAQCRGADRIANMARTEIARDSGRWPALASTEA